MTITWDSKADAKLMSAFTQTGSVDYEAVARYMGDGCTVSAVKHRIARLRDKAGITNIRTGRKASGTPKKTGGDSFSPGAGASTASSKDDANESSPSSKKKGSSTPVARRKRAGSFGPIHAGRGMKSSSSKDSGSDVTDNDEDYVKEEKFFEG